MVEAEFASGVGFAVVVMMVMERHLTGTPT
jgi:hypothetical protein